MNSKWSSKYVLPPGKNWIGVSKIIIYEPVLTLSQKNTKCTYKSSFAKLSKIQFFSENCVFLLKRFCFERIFFFTVFSCVWRHLLRGFCVVIDFCFQNCCFAKESFTFSKNLFFSKNDNRLKNVTQNRKKHEISAFCVFLRKSAKPFSRVIAFRRAALNCFFGVCAI